MSEFFKQYVLLTFLYGGCLFLAIQTTTNKAFANQASFQLSFSGSTSTTSRKRNLMVFIKPTILRLPEDASHISHLKYNEIGNKEIEQRDKGLNLMADDVLPVLVDVGSVAD